MKTFKIYPSHSEVQFKIKHLMISTVTGSFGQYDANLERPDEGFEISKVEFSAKID